VYHVAQVNTGRVRVLVEGPVYGRIAPLDNALYSIDADPAFASLRSDPRFTEIKRKMGISS
jgi:hypothetical protein